MAKVDLNIWTAGKTAKEFKMEQSKSFIFGMITLVLLGLSFIGCNKANTPNIPETPETPENKLSGLWGGNISGGDVTVLVAEYDGVPSPYKLGGWFISIPEINHFDNGTFAMIDGVTANLYSLNIRGAIVGTATIGESNTMDITLNRNSIAPGTYTLTRRENE